MTRNFRPLLLALVALSGACAGESPVGPAATASPTDATALVASPLRPFGGRCTTDVAVLPPAEVDPPYLLRLHITYACQLQHLGRTTAIAEQVLDLRGAPDHVLASNTTTYTAANGDQLFASWAGTSTVYFPNFTFTGPETYLGGTGRFAGASGSSVIVGTGSFTGPGIGSGEFTATGKLEY